LSKPTLLALFAALATVVSGAVTYATLTGLAPYKATPTAMVVMVLVNLTLVLTLGALIAWRLVRLWAQRRSGAAGSRLHVRLVVTFSAIAIVPAIIVAVFAAVSLNLGMETWFSARVRTALDNSVNVAQAYVKEHAQTIISDILPVAADLNAQGPKLKDDPARFGEFLEQQAKAHLLPAISIIDSKGTVLISTKQPWVPELGAITSADIVQANQHKVVLLTEANDRFVSALMRLDAFVDAYLLVSRNVDPKVLEYQQNTNAAVAEYNRLSQDRDDIQLNFAVLYVVIALLILLAAVWLGLWAANRIVSPIGRLVGAAERVTEGDLGARVAVGRNDDEIGSLSHAFNRMTSQLEGQRNALVDANLQLDARRRFTEAMLAGVSAGVVGLNGEGRITLINRTAAQLLNAAPEEIEGRHYAECMPELAALIRRAMREAASRTSGQVDIKRDGVARHLNVQVSSEAGEKEHGFVVTFDDISDLVSAQRTAAWADVARRIAHEIKNPLTPIQLSAERLKRKYADEVASDPEVFKQCTDTIIRQVHDIGRMVDEFSSFARMPAPVIQIESAQELVRQAVFLQRVAQPQVAFDVNLPKDIVQFECDGRLVAQALTNVLKNAGEAIAARVEKGDDTRGRIVIDVNADEKRVVIAVRDNGVGLPKEHRHRLTEPYVTTRAKGTGLGLAIVRKILEDHGGELTLEDAPNEAPGAVVRMAFPLRQRVNKQTGLGHETERVAGSV